MISIAYCDTPGNNPKPNLNFPDFIPTTMLFLGCQHLLKSLPGQSRLITSLSVTTVSTICTVLNKAVDKKIAERNSFPRCFATQRKNPANQDQFKANSPIEEYFTMGFQSKYFVFLLCFLLLILALIIFTIIVSWVIVHKYNTWVLYLHKKLQNKIVFIYFEKIKQMSTLTIFYFVVFFYADLCFCIYLLLYFF